MPTRLIALDGGPDITLRDHVPIIMGRDPRCDARLNSLRVSRFHCCVARIADGVHVSDLGSTNGTRINGRCVRSGRLGLGDELTIGHLRFRVEAASTSPGACG
jgi:pSer/pThr/pTyr-binding forkhead associated (FHA) protein